MSRRGGETNELSKDRYCLTAVKEIIDVRTSSWNR